MLKLIYLNMKKLNKKTINIILIIGVLIGISSLIYYALYHTWLGLIGTGIGLLIIAISNQLKKKEIIEKYKSLDKTHKRINNILKHLLWILLIISILNGIYLILFMGDALGGTFAIMIGVILGYASWRIP